MNKFLIKLALAPIEKWLGKIGVTSKEVQDVIDEIVSMIMKMIQALLDKNKDDKGQISTILKEHKASLAKEVLEAIEEQINISELGEGYKIIAASNIDGLRKIIQLAQAETEEERKTLELTLLNETNTEEVK